MRRIYLILFLAVLAMSGCTNPEAAPEQTKVMEESNSEAESSRENEPAEAEGEIAEETYLDLTELVDCAPFYSMSFQKVEGGTGRLLLFEGNTEISDQNTVGPDQVKVEPEDAVWELCYAFGGEEALADTVTLSFWNRGEAETIRVLLDGLEYEFSCPRINPKEIQLGQKLEDTRIVLEDVKLYPNALLLRLSGVDSESWDKTFFLLDEEKEEKILPARSAYEKEAEEMYLLFAFENGIPEKPLVFRMKDNDSAGEERFYDLTINPE